MKQVIRYGQDPVVYLQMKFKNIILKPASEDAFNSKFMRNLRRSFRRGERPDGCRNCWREEDAGKKSKRQYMLEKFKNEDALGIIVVTMVLN